MTKKEHGSMARHHAAMVEHHDKAADLHEQLATANESTYPKHAECHKNLAACHKAMSNEHSDEAERHLHHSKTADDEIEKSASSEDMKALLSRLDKLLAGAAPLPNGLSVIPRYGAPDSKTIAEAKKSMDPTLRGIVTDPSEAEPSSIAFNETRQ